MGTFALVKNRTADFPYKTWNLAPHRDFAAGPASADKLARLSMSVGGTDLTIGITGVTGMCAVARTNAKALLDLINVSMLPGRLLTELQRRGVNLLPTAADAERTTELTVKKVSSAGW